MSGNGNRSITYERHPRSPFREGSRTDRIFAIIAEAGEAGIKISELIEKVKGDEDQQGVDQDVRTKISTWSNLSKNPTRKISDTDEEKASKKFMLVVDQKGKKGRPPEGETFDRRVAIVFDGEARPEWALDPKEVQPES
jgi:hypothetical protein